MGCPSAGDWPAWTRPSGSRAEACWGSPGRWLEPAAAGPQDTQPPTPSPCTLPPEGPRGQARTAGPSLQTPGSPRLGRVPSHFLPKTGAHLESPTHREHSPSAGGSCSPVPRGSALGGFGHCSNHRGERLSPLGRERGPHWQHQDRWGQPLSSPHRKAPQPLHEGFQDRDPGRSGCELFGIV